MAAVLDQKISLNDGHEMPCLGLGTYKARSGSEVEEAVTWALERGYRSIDTAAFYRNEDGVGRAIAGSDIPRDELFVTSKVWNSDQGYDRALRAFDQSLAELGLEYLDLYLIHWPLPDQFIDTWKALMELKRSGRVRSIGVSNFQVHHLQTLMEHGTPAVNQVECHPYLSQQELRRFCKTHDIVVEAWSPIARGEVVGDSTLRAIGEHYGKSEVQVTLRWQIDAGLVTIPKSTHKDRISHNADIFDFRLTQSELERIEGLNRDYRIGPHPDRINF